jgi:hypothetical protein
MLGVQETTMIYKRKSWSEQALSRLREKIRGGLIGTERTISASYAAPYITVMCRWHVSEQSTIDNK